LAAPAAQVDAIVSTASIGQVEGTPDSFAKDRDAIAVMTKALGDSGKPFIFTSGSAIFGVFTKGEASPTIFDEDHPVPLPASVFAPPEAELPPPFIDAFGGAMAPRAETEMAVLKAAGIRGIAIRPGLVYGEGKGYDLSNLIALAKTQGAAPHLGAGGVRQGYIHIDDLVEFYVLALERAPAGTMLHAVTDEIALGDLAAAVSRLVGAGGRTEALTIMEIRHVVCVHRLQSRAAIAEYRVSWQGPQQLENGRKKCIIGSEHYPRAYNDCAGKCGLYGRFTFAAAANVGRRRGRIGADP
jgi:nucleoside-diphosphate-sugar epimerase